MSNNRDDKSKELSELSLEETFSAVENVINRMQNDSIPLEESFKYYEEGIRLLKHGNEYIDNIEKQIQILSKEEQDDDI